MPGLTGKPLITLWTWSAPYVQPAAGFRANTDAGNGRNIVNAPLPADAGFDNGAAVTIANYTFFLNVGADGARNTADDIVSGSSTDGAFSQRTSGADGRVGMGGG